MASISSVPTTRVSDLLVQEKLLSQVQIERARLLNLQLQISTGRRFSLPSEDPNAALRGVASQILLARNAQIKTNLDATATFFDASENSLASVANLLNSVKSTALGAVGQTSPAERAAALASIDTAIDSVLRLANQNFRGRYLFAGAQTGVQPFVRVGDTIQYRGDTQTLSTYSDITSMIQSNLTGDQVFGAISTSVLGAANLNPVLTENTPLSQLRGGRGVSSGVIAVSDGTDTSLVNIAGAVTIGDVARLLEKYPPGWDAVPPSGRTLTAHVTPQGLQISLNGGDLSIRDVSGGTTAGELGLRGLGGAGPGPFTGGDVDPMLTRTTELADLLGTRARTYLTIAGANNDLIVEAANNGAAYNGVKVKLVNDGYLQAGSGLTAGSEVATLHTTATSAKASLVLPGAANDLLLTAVTPGEAFNDVTVNIVNGGNIGNNALAAYSGTVPKSLTLTIDDSGETEIDTLIAAINGTGVFTAARDTTGNDTTIDGTASVPVSAVGAGVANTYNTGNDANTLEVRIRSNYTTANDVIAAINATGVFTAQLDRSETNNTGQGRLYDSATDPAVVGVTSGGGGVNFDSSAGIRITSSGTNFDLSFANAKTIDDLLYIINGSGTGVVAQLNDAGTGINVQSIVSGGDFAIGELGGTTAAQLGIRSFDSDTALAALNRGVGVSTMPGVDFRVTRSDGVAIDIDLDAGVYATASLNGAGANDALLFSRKTAGASGNSFSVQVTDSGGGGGNAVSLVGNTLTFNVDIAAGFTANDAIALLAGSPLAADFAARIDTTTDAGNTGADNLAAGSAVAFAGGRNTALTIGDVLNIINHSPTNLGSGTPLVARLATFGNGIELVDGSGGTGALSVSGAANANTAVDLGLIPVGATTSDSPTSGGGSQVLTGSDTNPQEVRGVFTALLQLRQAVSNNDPVAIGRAVSLLENGLQRVTDSRGDIGVRRQAIDDMQLRLQDENVLLQRSVSQDLDVDLADAISQLVSRQSAYEAALRATGAISQLTLLNFL